MHSAVNNNSNTTTSLHVTVIAESDTINIGQIQIYAANIYGWQFNCISTIIRQLPVRMDAYLVPKHEIHCYYVYALIITSM